MSGRHRKQTTSTAGDHRQGGPHRRCPRRRSSTSWAPVGARRHRRRNGIRWLSADPPATGPSIPVTATTVACSSARASNGYITAASSPRRPTWPPVNSRSSSPCPPPQVRAAARLVYGKPSGRTHPAQRPPGRHMPALQAPRVTLPDAPPGDPEGRRSLLPEHGRRAEPDRRALGSLSVHPQITKMGRRQEERPSSASIQTALLASYEEPAAQ